MSEKRVVVPRPFDVPCVSSSQHAGGRLVADITASLQNREGTRRLAWCTSAAKNDSAVVPVRRRRRRSLSVSKSNIPSQKSLPFLLGVRMGAAAAVTGSEAVSKPSKPVVPVAKMVAESGLQKSSNASSDSTTRLSSARPETNAARPCDYMEHDDVARSETPSMRSIAMEEALLHASSEVVEEASTLHLTDGIHAGFSCKIGGEGLGSGILGGRKEEEEEEEQASSKKPLVVPRNDAVLVSRHKLFGAESTTIIRLSTVYNRQ